MDQADTLLLSGRWEDPPAAQSLVDAFHGSYRRLVVQLYVATGDLAEAEHVVQEAYAQAASALAGFVEVLEPEAWLRTVAFARHHRRARHARARLVARGVGEPRRPDVLRGLGNHLDAHAEAVRVLRRLPDEEREVLALHEVTDLPVAQVAAALRLPRATVEWRLSRARTMLNRVLEEEDVASPR